MPEAERKPNWSVWTNVPTCKVWEAVALSLDVDPREVEVPRDAWMANGAFIHEEGADFSDRLLVLRRNLGGSGLRLAAIRMGQPDYCDIYTAEFAAWALSLGWAIPDAFAAIARGRPNNEKKETPAELGARERETALRIIVGLLAHSFKLTELDKPYVIAREIQQSLAAASLSLSDDTIAKWVKEAVALLPSSGKSVNK